MARPQHYIDGVLAWPDKTSPSVLDYAYVFTPRMDEGDYLTTFSATVTEGEVNIVGTPAVTTIDPFPENQAGMVWLNGGEPGEICAIYLYATTAKGAVMDDTVKLRIKE